MLLYSIARIFCIFCIPYTGCLFKHALKSKLSSLVNVLDRPRHNCAYRPPKTLKRLFWPFRKTIWRKSKKRSTASFFSIGGVFGYQYVYFWNRFHKSPFCALLIALKPWLGLVFGVLLRGSYWIMFKALLECFFGFLAFFGDPRSSLGAQGFKGGYLAKNSSFFLI